VIIAYGELSDHVQRNEMGGAYSMYEGEEKYIKEYGGEKTRGRRHSEVAGVGRRTILKLILEE
jgi:hypothetical protein